MKEFPTIQEAASFIRDHANTGEEMTVNDSVSYGMGVYATTNECIAAGLAVSTTGSAFHHLDERELKILLSYLMECDGYLIAV